MRSFRRVAIFAAILLLTIPISASIAAISVTQTVSPQKTRTSPEVITVSGSGVAAGGSVQLLVNGTGIGTYAADDSGNWTVIDTVELVNGPNQIAVVDPGPPVSSANGGTVTYDPTPPSATGASTEVTPAGPGVNTIKVRFNEKMDTSVNPIVTITTAGGAQVFPALANPVWVSDTLFTAQFTIPVDSANGTATIGVSGAKDEVGNTMVPNPNVGSFVVDTNQISQKPRLVRPNPDRTTNITRYVSTLTPQFEWTKVSGALRYVVHVVTEPAGWSAPFPDVNSANWRSANPVTYEASSPWTISQPLTNGATYHWGVVAYDIGNHAMTSEPSGKFAIRTTPIRLISPKNNTGSKEVNPRFTWMGANISTWTYDLEVSRTPTFSPLHSRSQTGIQGTLTIESTTADAARQLTEEGSYYWRVKARDDYGNVNAVSETWTLNVDFTPPEPPNLIKPDNNAFFSRDSSQSIDFVWSQVTGAEKYELQIDPDSSAFSSAGIMTWVLTRGASFTSAVKAVTTLNRDGDYFWRVLSMDKAGNRSDANKPGTTEPYFPSIPFRKFDIDTIAPDGNLLRLISPIDDVFTKETKPMFTWSFGGPATDVQSYEIFVSTNKQFTAEAGHPVSDSLWTCEVKSTATRVAYQFTKKLPQQGRHYWKVRVKDKAGNMSNFSYYETFRLDTVAPPAPSIIEPSDQAVINSSTVSVTVQLNSLIGGSGSTLPERQTVRIYSVHGRNLPGSGWENNEFVLVGEKAGAYGETQITVDVPLDNFNGSTVDGPVKLSATAVDQAGNESKHADPVNIIIDIQAPKITQLVLTNDNLGSGSSVDPNYSGKVICSIEFSEPMDTTTKPTVQIQSETGKFLPDGEPVPAPNKPWSEDGRTYTAIVKVPLGIGYDGLATVYIRGDCKDLAGRLFTPNPAVYARYFRIDTAPKLKVKVFYNPTDERDLIISVESSEVLAAIPRVEVDTGTIMVKPLVSDLANEIYVSKYTITGNEAGEIDVTAYGTDLAGNVGKGIMTFVIEDLFVDCLTKIVAPSGAMSVEVPAGAVLARGKIMIIEDPAATAGSQGSSKLSAALGKVVATDDASARSMSGQALVMVGGSYDIGPRSLKLAADCPVTIEMPSTLPDGVDPDKVGLYQYADGGWKFLGRNRQGGTVTGATRGSGRLALFFDGKAPDLAPVSPENGETVTTSKPRVVISFSEAGSGINPATLVMRVDGRVVEPVVDGAEREIVFMPAERLAEGPHSIEAVISDNCGNESAKVSVSFKAPAPFGLTKAYAWPNPANRAEGSKIVYDLTQQAIQTSIRIFDKAGDIVRDLDFFAVNTQGVNTVQWDLTDEEGEEVANGVYYARIRTCDGAETVERFVKIAVLR